jgi:hypothetical protein
LRVPDDHSTSFVSPVLNLEHQLKLEFYLSPINMANTDEEEADGVTVEPLSFNISIEISHFGKFPRFSSSLNSNSAPSKAGLQYLCLESTQIKVPIIE